MISGIVTSFVLVSLARGHFLESFLFQAEDLPTAYPFHDTTKRGVSFLQQAPGISFLQEAEQPVSLLHQAPEEPADHASVLDTDSTTGMWIYSHAASWWQFLATFTFAGVIKGCCITGNIISQVSPYPQVMRWQKRGDTGGADAAPYLSIAFGGWQWCFYGAFAWLVTGRRGFLVLLQSNSLGALLGTYYTITFLRTCQVEASRMVLFRYLSGVSALVLFEASAVATLPAERALFLAGLISAFCGFLGALSVLVTVPRVIETKDATSISGPLVTAGMCSGLAWSICGIILEDRLITAPSMAYLCACTTCVYCKLVYESTEGATPEVGKGAEQAPLVVAATLKNAQLYGASQGIEKKVGNKEGAFPENTNPFSTTGGTF